MNNSGFNSCLRFLARLKITYNHICTCILIDISVLKIFSFIQRLPVVSFPGFLRLKFAMCYGGVSFYLFVVIEP